jgi:hypothetical protein
VSASFKVEKPENIEVTLTMTMRLKDWNALSRQLANEWPSSDLSRTISDVTNQANKVFWPTREEE